jgi:hypothetical protein
MLSVSIDGISTMSARNSAPLTELFPSNDGISEIRVSEINNTAEFGGVSDITTISKSGTNDFHGGVFENHINSYFSARNTFSPTVPKVINNDFGAFGGGPIIKNKTFVFMDYEALRLPGQTVLVESVPSLALRKGDLSVYLPKQINDVDGTPFPGNQITKINPLSAAIMEALFPKPNSGAPNAITNNYVQNFPTPISSNQGDGRVDHNINSAQTIFGRLTYKHRDQNRLPSGSTTPGSLSGSALAGGVVRPENDWSLTGAHNWVINAHVVNEFRAGWTGFNASSSFGINGGQIEDQLGLTPYIPQGHDFLSKVNATPNVRITGFQRTGGVGSSQQKTSNYQFLDNLTYIRGNHTVKAGGDFRYLKALYTSVFDTLWLGSYSFTNSVTGPVIGNCGVSPWSSKQRHHRNGPVSRYRRVRQSLRVLRTG